MAGGFSAPASAKRSNLLRVAGAVANQKAPPLGSVSPVLFQQRTENSPVLTHAAYRLNATLERFLPEQRLFLKSDTETRFIRLRPVTQAIAITGGAMFLAWTIVATAVLMMDSIGAGSAREQTQRQQTLYEERLNALSDDRDLRVDEAVRAQERFNLALEQVAQMQARLLNSEDRRRELETGIDVIQNTLRRAIKERDLAQADAERAAAVLAAQIDKLKALQKDYLNLREIIRKAAGETLDLKPYEADMRHLIDTYIEAQAPRKISPFDGVGLLDLRATWTHVLERSNFESPVNPNFENVLLQELIYIHQTEFLLSKQKFL